MPVDVKELIEAVAILCENRNLKVAVSNSLKGGLVTGVSATLGGLLFGPIGLALGGAIGGTMSAVSSKGKFKTVASIILEMSSAKKLLLYNKIKNAFQHFGAEDVVTLTMMIMSQPSLQELAIREVVNFLNNEMSLSILN